MNFSRHPKCFMCMATNIRMLDYDGFLRCIEGSYSIASLNLQHSLIGEGVL